MEGILTVLVIWGLYKFFFSSSKPAQAPVKKRRSSYTKSTTTSARSTKPSPSIKKSSYSEKYRKSPNYERTYSGPQFAQPGEKSKLFGYASFEGAHLLQGPFAIIDLETSGFNPPECKILEIAILKIDSKGNEIERFTTLIDPQDDNVGRTDIHQIDLSMLIGAPNFEEVSGRILEMIEDSVVVAHNARFEENFLFHELTEAGLDLPIIPALDTLWLSRQTKQLPNYKLQTVVSSFEENFANQHTALGDVIAVSKILPKMISLAKPIFYPIPFSSLPKTSTPFKPLPR